MKEKIKNGLNSLSKKCYKYASHLTLTVVLFSIFTAYLIASEINHTSQTVKLKMQVAEHEAQAMLMTSMIQDQSDKLESLSDMVTSMKGYIDKKHEDIQKQNLVIEFLIKKLKEADAWPPSGTPFKEEPKKGLEA